MNTIIFAKKASEKEDISGYRELALTDEEVQRIKVVEDVDEGDEDE